MYFFHENHKLNKLMSEQPKNEDKHDQNKMTIFKAKHERFQVDNNAEQLQNRVNHIIFKQNQTNQKVYSQKQKAISLFKEKQIVEQDKRKKAEHKAQQKIKLNMLTEQVQHDKKVQVLSIKENNFRVKQLKKNRQSFIKNETQDMERQITQQNELDLKYNRMKANLVKERLHESKLNITNFWDKKLQNYDILRHYEMHEQEHYKNQKKQIYRHLENKEEDLIQTLQNTMTAKNDAQGKFASIQQMSTQQFKGKHPQFFQQIDLNLQIEQLMQSTDSHFRSFSTNNKYDKYAKTGLNFRQQQKVNSNIANQQIKNIYMKDQDAFAIVK